MIQTHQVGQKIPDFTLEAYNPATGDFDQRHSNKLQDAGTCTS